MSIFVINFVAIGLQLCYTPDFDSFERVKTLYALLYKDLESFSLPKKMRIIFIILFVRKFFLNLYMYLFHNRF